ncbi:hypothetical protein CVO77_11875 [Sphingopyxis lindanitolerans]|uniref:Uncharacterized protein n=1 Tax=Sphingopyxis lindanitolerans TaxID=2054227 RepID=A0A2S8B9J6_9SPHN|nr:hypothetical protein CVO77_11875 [Sphingopyxis lindanitolerans]
MERCRRSAHRRLFPVMGISPSTQAQGRTHLYRGARYLGLKLDDPSFAAPIYANLFEGEGGKEFSPIWSRTNRKNGD